MNTQEKQVFLATYGWAKSWQDLPWSHQEPTLFLAEICRRRPPGRALDIGCGAGTDSVFLAGQGWTVTALDFVPQALDYTRERARAAGVQVTAVEADVTAWRPDAAYDLVLDHGLLHNLDRARHAAYRATVLQALAPDGDFVLLHWHPRFPGQPDGRMGPHRAERGEVADFFAPELQERWFARQEFEDLADVVGGGMAQACYWFRRSPAHQRPGDVIAGLRATLARHGIDVDSRLAAAGDGHVAPPLPAALLARIVGPGRLGLTHRDPAPGEAAAVLARWAAGAGIDARLAGNLLALLGGGQHAAVCVAGAPRCEACEVRTCKRLLPR